MKKRVRFTLSRGDNMLNDKRVRIIAGHYGSGKTEFAVNYTLMLAASGLKTAIADLDIVNPYFRSREKEPMFVKHGVRVIGSSLKGVSLDVPSVSPEVYSLMQDKSISVVLDVGGDKAGARALGRYHEYLDNEPYDMFFVLNANRHLTNDVEGAVNYLRSIEDGARQKFTGIINNTHMCGETTIEDVIKGYELAKKVAEATNIPIKYNVVVKSLLDKVPAGLEGEIFPIDIYMKKPWED